MVSGLHNRTLRKLCSEDCASSATYRFSNARGCLYLPWCVLRHGDLAHGTETGSCAPPRLSTWGTVGCAPTLRPFSWVNFQVFALLVRPWFEFAGEIASGYDMVTRA